MARGPLHPAETPDADASHGPALSRLLPRSGLGGLHRRGGTLVGTSPSAARSAWRGGRVRRREWGRADRGGRGDRRVVRLPAPRRPGVGELEGQPLEELPPPPPDAVVLLEAAFGWQLTGPTCR